MGRRLWILLIVLLALEHAFLLWYVSGRERAPQPLLAIPHQELLTDREYYHRLMELLPKSNSSVKVLMFSIKYDPGDPEDWANDLLRELVELRRRGIRVMVLVDDYTFERYKETISFLLSHGVEVRLDPSGRITMHAKVVIIDDRLVIVGSHNWSESGLTYNNEVSLLTYDPRIVQEALAYFNSLWERGRPVSP